jgi:folate-binding protein YgfZ
MSDLTLAASPAATPLTAWLASGDSQPSGGAYHGAITSVRFDEPTVEIEALTTGAAVHDLGWLRRVEVRGEDRFRWLSGMVTNTVKDLGPSAGAWNLVLNSQGRIQGDVTTWRNATQHDSDADDSGDKLEMEIAADQHEKLIAHFEHYIIMDDVELVTRERETAIGLSGPRAGEVMARLGLPRPLEPMTHTRADWNGLSLRIRRSYGVLAEHYEMWTTIATVAKLWKFLLAGGATPVGFAALESLRIAEAIPSYGVDIAERDLPQETSQMRALHFNKGCYLGQEIVERIRSRGNVHRHLRQVELEGPLPEPGAELTLDGKAVGQVTSAAELPLRAGPRRLALAMVRAEAETACDPLHYAAKEAAGIASLLERPPVL